jgi:hypothetical protein
LVAAINKDNFGGRQNVSCWTCHHRRDRPQTTPALEVVDGQGAQTLDDVIQPMDGAPIAAPVLDKYIQALGGAAKLATIKSYSATGTSVGFGGGGEVQIFAKAPDSRTTWIQFKKETERPDAIRVTNGRTAWVKAPPTVLGEYELTGGELDGAKLDAQMSFPGQVKQILTQMRVGPPTAISDLPGPDSQTKDAGASGIGQD